jgi:1,4-alpha-glucan branching enzyme
VYLAVDARTHYTPREEDRLVENPGTHHFTGFVPGVSAGTAYRFWVVGEGSEGFKRDPYARELHYLDGLVTDAYENTNGIVVDGSQYVWLAPDYRPPPFHELVVYQLHVGVFYALDDRGRDARNRTAKLFDAAERLPYLSDLGVNAIQPLPLVEFWSETSEGYNGTDLMSVEMDYCVTEEELDGGYLSRVNALLARKGIAPKRTSELVGHANQLKLFVDLCHLYGIAVIGDVVLNHAGGAFNSQSIDYFNRPIDPGRSNNLYFDRNGAEWAGGRVFEYDEPDVRQYLIDVCRTFLLEYRMDGLRHDEVRVIDWNGGFRFLQDLTATLRFAKPSAVQIAEYWGDVRELGVLPPPRGLGFDLGYDDRLRDAVRETLAEATEGEGGRVRVSRIANALFPRREFDGAFRQYVCLENHDLEDANHSESDRKPRIARLAGGNDSRSWFATSRSRVANALLLTAPGTPMLFMGQEFLEDKFWSDDPRRSELLIWWDGLSSGDRAMVDFVRFMRELCWLRRNTPALTGEGFNPFHANDDSRVLAFHRWVEGEGRDVVVVASLSERTYYDRSYRIGFPGEGHWDEIFNSDVYEAFFNPNAQGNYGGVDATGPGLHGLPCSAGITIPANGVLVFERR